MSNGGRRANHSSIGPSEEFDFEAPKLEIVSPALNSVSLHPSLIKIKPLLLWSPILICCLAMSAVPARAADVAKWVDPFIARRAPLIIGR